MHPPDALPLFDALLRGMLLSLLLALAATVARERPLGRARTALWLPLGMCVQMVSSMPAIEGHLRPIWQAPMVGISVGNAVLFWLFVAALFDDEFELRRAHAVAWLGAVLLGAFNAGVIAELRSPLAPWTFGAQRVIPIACAGLAIWASVRQWQSDLVESRRRLRLFIVVVGTVYTVLQVSMRVHSGTGMLSASGALVDTALMLLLVAGTAWRVLRVAPQELFGPSAILSPAAAKPAEPSGLRQAAPDASIQASVPMPSANPSADPPGGDPANPADPAEPADPADAADVRLEQALLGAMRDERAYREEALSVSSLARRLAVPEYRLRRVILQRLGHRNFNAFVNGYRLAQAQAALADPARRSTPVLTIALDTGFQSIGPFNRAFKAATGLTPTEYRAAALAKQPGSASGTK